MNEINNNVALRDIQMDCDPNGEEKKSIIIVDHGPSHKPTKGIFFATREELCRRSGHKVLSDWWRRQAGSLSKIEGKNTSSLG